jgi:hypothetical protein
MYVTDDKTVYVLLLFIQILFNSHELILYFLVYLTMFSPLYRIYSVKWQADC